MKIVLAFDIERCGSTTLHDTIAIGASVMDENYLELDSLLLLGYVPEINHFEVRCWEEFWSKNKEVLESLKYTGDLSYSQRQREMIEKFQEFRRKWEIYCDENKHELILVSDNNVFDGGFINQMIFTHLPQQLPIPYNVNNKQYEIFHETFSMQRGILKIVDPEFDSNWGIDKKITEIYNIPDISQRKNTIKHNPQNDAYNIAFDYQIMNGIQSGKIKMKTNYIIKNIYRLLISLFW